MPFNTGLRTWQTARHRLLQAVDVGLAGVIFVAPLFMGGRGPVGRLVFATIVCFAALAWALRQCSENRARWVWSGAELLILSGLAVVVLQLLPLPAWLLAKLSPTTLELLPLWRADADRAASLGTWNHISLAPVATREGLAMYLAYAMLFTVVVQRIASVDDVERILRWIALAATGMAAIGLLQFLVGNGKFLWIYQHPSRNTYGLVKGTFANQNHFAHFLALGLGPLIWWLHRLGAIAPGSVLPAGRSPSRSRSTSSPVAVTGWHTSGSLRSGVALRHALAVAFGLVVFAGLLTFSRGGAIALFVASATSIGIYTGASLIGKRSLFVVSAMAALVLAALLIHGYEPLARRLSTLRDARSLEDVCRGRNALWRAHAAAIPKFPLFGSGVGSHRQIYPVYMKEHFDVEFSHGENGYLHLLLETGLAGLACMLVGIGLALSCAVRAVRRGGRWQPARFVACGGAMIAGLFASVAHSFGDFVWYIPACMSLTVILAACSCRLLQLRQYAEEHSGQAPPIAGSGAGLADRGAGPRGAWHPAARWLPRPAWAGVAAGVLLVSCGMLRDLVPAALASPHWDKYLRQSYATNMMALDDKAVAAGISSLVTPLEEVLARHPSDARANLRMAGLLLREFDLLQKRSPNPMSLSQIRDAAIASRFPSRQAQDAWLEVAVGENRRRLDRALFHARRAVQMCPLQGEGYIYLADLAFLASPTATAKEAYVAQAQKVRPHAGLVQFAVGREAALAGDATRAIECWKKAFHQDPEVQAMIVEAFAPQMPAALLLKEFQPDLSGLSRLYHYYQRANRPEEACQVGKQYALALAREAAFANSAAAASARWHEACLVQEFLGNVADAVQCEQQAVACAPNDGGKRRALARLLLRAGRHAEATDQLQWCLRRGQDDSQLADLLAQAARQRLEAQRPPKAEGDHAPEARHWRPLR